jgi:hypothetical protein
MWDALQRRVADRSSLLVARPGCRTVLPGPAREAGRARVPGSLRPVISERVTFLSVAHCSGMYRPARMDT